KPWWPSVRRRPLRQCPRLAAWGEWTSRSASLLTPLPAGARVRVSAASPFLAASSERGGWGHSLVCRGRRGTRHALLIGGHEKRLFDCGTKCVGIVRVHGKRLGQLTRCSGKCRQ